MHLLSPIVNKVQGNYTVLYNKEKILKAFSLQKFVDRERGSDTSLKIEQSCESEFKNWANVK